MGKIIPVLVCTILSVSVFAQIDLRNYDTVPVLKPLKHILSYEFRNRNFHTISIRMDKIVLESKLRRGMESTRGPESLSGILGGVPVSNRLLPNALISDPPGYGWDVDFYIKGTTGGDRVATADGRSIEIPEYLKSYWLSGALGLIRQGSDTLSAFLISPIPEKDSLFRTEYLKTRGLHPPVDPIRKRWDEGLELRYKNYGVLGEFKGASIKIIFYERNRTAYIFMNNDLDAIFQIDYDIPGARIIISDKKFQRVPPLLLLRKGVTEDQEADLSRLAIFTMLMAQLTK